MRWRLVFTKQAQKDACKLDSAGLKPNAHWERRHPCRLRKKILDVLAENPYTSLPAYEKLVGDLAGAFSRRINIQHRLVYQIVEDAHTVKILRMWTHYE